MASVGSAFVAALEKYFSLFASAHNTYVFVLCKDLPRGHIEKIFPDDVTPKDRRYLENLFSGAAAADFFALKVSSNPRSPCRGLPVQGTSTPRP